MLGLRQLSIILADKRSLKSYPTVRCGVNELKDASLYDFFLNICSNNSFLSLFPFDFFSFWDSEELFLNKTRRWCEDVRQNYI